MAAVSQAELPGRGLGSATSYDKIFNFESEYKRAREVIERFGEAVGVPAVLGNLQRQVRTYLSEFGVGERALTMQPFTRFVIGDFNGRRGVYAYKLDEYGEQSQKYLNFDEQPEAIGRGLSKAFSLLAESEVGEAVVIVSPTELYDDYDSKGDVLNPLVVTQKSDGGVEVVGWYLFVDGGLSNEERAFLLDVHDKSIDLKSEHIDFGYSDWSTEFWTDLQDGIEGLSNGQSFGERIVSSPHSFVFPVDLSRLEKLPGDLSDSKGVELSYEVLAPYLQAVDELFRQRFEKYLFSFDADWEKRALERIESFIKANANNLLDFLLSNRKLPFLETLWAMASEGHEQWADDTGRDVGDYMYALQEGLIRVVGFHPTTSEGLDRYWDPVANSWIGGDNCGPLERSNCEKHGEHEGDECPECKSEAKK